MTKSTIEHLSDRELEILRLISEGSSDREISQKLYLSINTVKWHNRQIYAKLGVGSRTEALVIAAERKLLEDLPAKADQILKTVKHNLPTQISSFIGREREIKEIKELLKTTRLLTLTGPGGVGKTRLALQVCAQLVDETVFDDGIYFVDLAPVTNPDRVGDVIIKSLDLVSLSGLPDPEIIENFLKEKKILLLTDNFEHLLEAAPLIRDLLSIAPYLTIISTSRERLNISGEQIYPISSLELPDLMDNNTLAELETYDSIDLFIQRAREVKHDFNPSDEDLILVAEICHKLDGLPLVIELAAARMKMFTLSSLLGQLDDRFAVLKAAPRDFPIRHQTLAQVIDWSYELLSAEERLLFNRLSVFRGGITLEAADQVCCHDLSCEVLDGLSSLIDKSLLRQSEGKDGELRLFMLETIHHYARRKLQASSEQYQIQLRHARYFTEMAERGKESTRGGPGHVRWLLRLEADHDNLRALYEWAFEGGDVNLGLRLVGALGYFWLKMYHIFEGREWTSKALVFLNGAPPLVQANVYASAAVTCYWNNEIAQSQLMCDQALKLYTELDNRQQMGWMHTYMMYIYHGNPTEDQDLWKNFEKGVALLEETGDKVGLCQAYTFLGVHERDIGNFSEARIFLEKSSSIAREIGDSSREVINLSHLGYLLLSEGDPETAQKTFIKSIELDLSLFNEKVINAGSLMALSASAMAMDQPERGLVLLGAAEEFYQMREGLLPQDVNDIQLLLDSVPDHLDESTCAQFRDQGRHMDYEQILAYAMEVADPI